MSEVNNEPSSVLSHNIWHGKLFFLSIAATLTNQMIFSSVTPREHYQDILNRVEAAFAPTFKERGLDWEFHIEQMERELWRINGINPPPTNSEGEKLWREENRPVPLN